MPCASCHGWRNAKKRARRYGSNQIADGAGRAGDRQRGAEDARRRAGDDEHAGEHHEQRDRGPHVGLEHQQYAEERCERADRLPELAQVARSGLAGEVAGRPDRERQLRELRRLEDRRAEGDPAARAVDRRPDHEHGSEQAERCEHEHRREQAQPAVVPALRDDHQDDPERRVDPLALQVVDRVAAADRRRRGGRAVDHHEAERDQRERDQDQQPGIELSPLHAPSF